MLQVHWPGPSHKMDTFLLAAIIIINQQIVATNAAGLAATRQDSQSFMRELKLCQAVVAMGEDLRF